eukprot:TRINITY_DN16343_c0_g3_i2.p1 TRINITY_DN16343_c0_g3~~TRINITY_DN16343_c0_g3_i2.p1  ORF type:complete len:574 (-),score=47.38 TRINITY_DN16343_c0_g3_i2:276-1997(-)
MIEYQFGTWGLGFLWTLHGSVFPRALAWALPAAVMTIVYSRCFRYVWQDPDNYPDVGDTSFTVIWGGYTFIVGFLLVFRTQIAFSRFWEGAQVLWAAKSVWITATSNVLAFTTADMDRQNEVEAFQHYIVRLMSMLFCASLQAVAELPDECFETLGDVGIQPSSLQYLAEAPDKCEVILHWVQRILVEKHWDGLVNVPAPILTRVFQELGSGLRDIQGAVRIASYPFPFPYAQTLSSFLLLNWCLAPLIAAYLMPNEAAAAVVTFCNTFALWSINYIAAELEMPFGEDPNDLPIAALQEEFNAGLRALMHPKTLTPPMFKYSKKGHGAIQCGHLSRLNSFDAMGTESSIDQDWEVEGADEPTLVPDGSYARRSTVHERMARCSSVHQKYVARRSSLRQSFREVTMGSTKSNVSFQGTENDGINFGDESPATGTIFGPHDNAAHTHIRSIDPRQTDAGDELTKLTSKDILCHSIEVHDADLRANTSLRLLQEDQMHEAAAAAEIRLRTNIAVSTAPEDGLRKDGPLEALTRLNDGPDEAMRLEQAALTEDLPSLDSPDWIAVEVRSGLPIKSSI